MTDPSFLPSRKGQVQQGMPVLDAAGAVVGTIRDESSASFLLWRAAQRDVVWVSKSAVSHTDSARLVLRHDAALA